MSVDSQEFKGNDVAEAISTACSALGTSQENLEIEVLHTGSAGIFGLCRKKACIRVTLRQKEPAETSTTDIKPSSSRKKGQAEKRKGKPASYKKQPEKKKTDRLKPADSTPPTPAPETKQSAEVPDGLKQYIDTLLDLAGFTVDVEVTRSGENIQAHITGDNLQEIIGQDGRTLDSLQYLIRKIISKNYTEKLQFSLDAGNYRASRLIDLEARGRKLAEEVKKTGRTKSIPSLNPSERRVVHLALQDDKEIRSRSVGEGLFKKVLIYKPGKEKKEPSKRRRGGNRRSKNSKKEQPSS
jgi:spoIIIJ-associated protein